MQNITYCINDGAPVTSSAIGKVVTAVGMKADGRVISSLGDEKTVRHASQLCNSVERMFLQMNHSYRAACFPTGIDERRECVGQTPSSRIP